MLINKEWQPLPGTRQAEIYPYLRKPDLLSSNSCVVRTPEQIILIDAGALASQTADLCTILGESYREKPRPILIYLTHGHIDHALHIDRYREVLTNVPVWTGIQEEGARYLIQGDRRKTIAELYGMECPSLKTDIHLLTAQDRHTGNTRLVHLPPGVSLILQTEMVQAGPELISFRQRVPIGGGDHLEFYPLPGHSPDGICIRSGEMLFIGDLLAATNPMVAGISGWNGNDLIRSLRLVLWLLDHETVRFCCPGHGGIIPADKARDLLERLHGKAGHLGNITEMNEERLYRITEFALELIDEAEEVFSSLAGRLLYTAYHLEGLEEEDAADRCRKAMQMDQIDGCLLDFRKLCHSLDAGKIRRVEFAHGALHVVEKIKTHFDPRPLSAVLPPLLINRGTRLLLDFIGIAMGSRNLEEFIPADLNASIENAVQEWQSSPRSDPSIIDDADDHSRYLAGLVSRIGFGPVAERPAIHFSPGEGLPFVHIAAARFSDTLVNFLEWINRVNQESMEIATGLQDGSPFITITPGWNAFAPTRHEGKKINSFHRRFLLCGLALKQEESGFRLNYVKNSEGICFGLV